MHVAFRFCLEMDRRSFRRWGKCGHASHAEYSKFWRVVAWVSRRADGLMGGSADTMVWVWAHVSGILPCPDSVYDVAIWILEIRLKKLLMLELWMVRSVDVAMVRCARGRE